MAHDGGGLKILSEHKVSLQNASLWKSRRLRDLFHVGTRLAHDEECEEERAVIYEMLTEEYRKRVEGECKQEGKDSFMERTRVQDRV